MRRPARRTGGFAEAQQPIAEPKARLADACALIVFHLMDGRGMSRRGLEAMKGRLFVSPATVWEITRKVNDGKLPAIHRADTKDLLDFLRQRGFEVAPLTWEVAARANELPPHHRDPWDRLLIATALIEGLSIITNDRAFAAYGVPTIW
jgi:PIN domain nuclease of toxin-antitoxin system